MLADMREAVWEHLSGLTSVVMPDGSTVLTPALHPEIPGDLAELPAFVVGLPAAAPSLDGTFEVELDVYVIAHPADTPGRDTALQVLADAVFDWFGGSRGIKVYPGVGDRRHLTTGNVTPRTITVGDISDYPAYLITIESPFVTC